MREKFENLSSSRIDDLPAAELGELIASLQKVTIIINIAIIVVLHLFIYSLLRIIILCTIGVLAIVVLNFPNLHWRVSI